MQKKMQFTRFKNLKTIAFTIVENVVLLIEFSYHKLSQSFASLNNGRNSRNK
jgi:hypothetical protein